MMATLKKERLDVIKKIILGLCIALTLSGCAQLDIKKEKTGWVIGSVAGAALGYVLGDGNALITIAATALGGYGGSIIGQMLDQEDQKDLMNTTSDILTRPEPEQKKPQQWASNHSGASATIKMEETSEYLKKQQVNRTQEVVKVTNLSLATHQYQTLKNSRVRLGPSTQHPIKGGMVKGTKFEAYGVTSNNWLAIGKNGVIAGYIYAPLAARTDLLAFDQTTNTPETPQAQTLEALDLDEMESDLNDDPIALEEISNNGELQVVNLDTLDAQEAIQDNVITKKSCKTMKYDITAGDGEEGRQRMMFCKDGYQSWAVI